MITIYSASWCGFCHMAKDYLDKKGIEYTDLDVEHDPEALKASVDKSGQRGIPVIDIDGTIIVGFNRPAIDEALAKSA